MLKKNQYHPTDSNQRSKFLTESKNKNFMAKRIEKTNTNIKTSFPLYNNLRNSKEF